MREAHTVEQVRAAEAGAMARLPEGALMARAAGGLATAILDYLGSAYGRSVVLLVGSGDNGGDALYAGAALARRGVQVSAWPLADAVHQAGLEALLAAGGRVITGAPARVDLVVDGIVGIGGRPGLRPNAVAAVEAVRGVPLVAVDVPSGVNVDTGELDGPHVTADLTVTFGTYKPAHLVGPAAQACGALQLIDLGLHLPTADVRAMQAADVRDLLVVPASESHKYTRGVVGVRAGSATYPGAALLAIAGASCGLAGMVRYVGDELTAERVRVAHPEVVGAGRVQAWVVGPGSSDQAADAVRDALADGVPTVLDADALSHLPAALPDNVVLTPHAGELAALIDRPRGEIEAAPLAAAREAAARWQTTVLLKGWHTVIAHPDQPTTVTTTGTPWLATAGAGDVLSGLIGALLASGLTPYDAACVGSWLHGAAATAASRGGPIVAGQVATALPGLIRSVEESSS